MIKVKIFMDDGIEISYDWINEDDEYDQDVDDVKSYIAEVLEAHPFIAVNTNNKSVLINGKHILRIEVTNA